MTHEINDAGPCPTRRSTGQQGVAGPVQVALAAAHDEERCFRVLPRTMLHNTITGTVSGLRDCGTLVILFLDGEDGRVIPVLIERRGFCHLLEGEACGPDALIGRSVAWDGNLVSFIERQ